MTSHHASHPFASAQFADVPYIGRERHENRRRSHQGTLFLKRALHYIRRYYPFWNASGGRDHIWMMLHDEGPCFAPREIRTSILLTHYGYWAPKPRPWGTYYDDNFMQDPRFYKRHIGDPDHPTPCFARGHDLVIPPWKVPSFWQRAFQTVTPAAVEARTRQGLVFFAGDLGLNRLKVPHHCLAGRLATTALLAAWPLLPCWLPALRHPLHVATPPGLLLTIMPAGSDCVRCRAIRTTCASAPTHSSATRIPRKCATAPRLSMAAAKSWCVVRGGMRRTRMQLLRPDVPRPATGRPPALMRSSPRAMPCSRSTALFGKTGCRSSFIRPVTTRSSSRIPSAWPSPAMAGRLVSSTR